MWKIICVFMYVFVNAGPFFNLRVHIWWPSIRAVQCHAVPSWKRRIKTCMNRRRLGAHTFLCRTKNIYIWKMLDKIQKTEKNGGIVARQTVGKQSKTLYMFAHLKSSCAGGGLWAWLRLYNKSQMDQVFASRRLNYRAVWRSKTARKQCVRKATDSSVYKHGKLCVCEDVCVCAVGQNQAPVPMEVNHVCSVFLWINKGDFWSKAGRDEGRREDCGEAGGGRRNKKEGIMQRDEKATKREKRRTRETVVFSGK